MEKKNISRIFLFVISSISATMDFLWMEVFGGFNRRRRCLLYGPNMHKSIIIM